MQDQNLIAWLSLSLVPGMSAALFHRLLNHFSSPLALLQQETGTEEPVCNDAYRALLQRCRDYAAQKATQKKVQQALEWRERNDCHILTFASPDYPFLLKEISDPPPVLYIRGSISVLSMPQLALVGSRKPSPGGRETARQLAGELAQGAYVINSGLALGIDAESHQGALNAKGRSIAVLGSGLEQLYPRRNLKLAECLLEKGALVSEFPLGAAPLAWHFPQRNRIISGLSQGVIVVEAALKSGSLITARFGLEQGREVFAVPGSPYSPMARGCNHLIKNGAKLVENAGDIVEDLGAFLELEHEQLERTQRVDTLVSAGARKLLAHLDANPASIDKLIQRSGLKADCLMTWITELEIHELVQAGPGGYSLSLSRA